MPPAQPYGADDEARLVQQILNGNTNAFTLIIERYGRLVASVVFKMVRQKEDQEDLCQEVFLKVYEKLGSFKFESRLSTWIANIAFNHCANFLKKRRIPFYGEAFSEGAPMDGDNYILHGPQLSDKGRLADTRMMAGELGKYIRTSLESLSGIQQVVIILFHGEDFSLEEIARITSLPANTVKSHLFRGRAIMKAQLSNYLNH